MNLGVPSNQMRKQIARKMGRGSLLTLCWLLWTLEQRYQLWSALPPLLLVFGARGREEEEIRAERGGEGGGQWQVWVGCGQRASALSSAHSLLLRHHSTSTSTSTSRWLSMAGQGRAGWLAPWRSRLLLALAGLPQIAIPFQRGTAIDKLFHSSAAAAAAAANSALILLYDSNISTLFFYYCNNKVPHDVWMGWMAAPLPLVPRELGMAMQCSAELALAGKLIHLPWSPGAPAV